MRLHIISDLHVEFGRLRKPVVEADVSIVAGDVGPGDLGIRWIQENIPDRPVIYVLGNHEFYGHQLPHLIGQLKAATRGTNIKLLENDVVEIGGISFLGATLWTDFAFDGDQRLGAMLAMNTMADFSEINCVNEQRTLRPEFLLELHQRSRKWIADVAREISGPKVIVTHHAPHPKSVSPQFVGHRLNPAFLSDLTELINSVGAKLWVHGHIHSSSDYHVGATRIINNPRGYVDENAGGFNPDLVVEI
jgi:Icc-related predicted phosphoesterase